MAPCFCKWPLIFVNFIYILLREGPLAHFDGPSLHKSRVFPAVIGFDQIGRHQTKLLWAVTIWILIGLSKINPGPRVLCYYKLSIKLLHVDQAVQQMVNVKFSTRTWFWNSLQQQTAINGMCSPINGMCRLQSKFQNFNVKDNQNVDVRWTEWKTYGQQQFIVQIQKCFALWSKTLYFDVCFTLKFLYL